MADVIDDAGKTIENNDAALAKMASQLLNSSLGNDTKFCVVCDEEIEAQRLMCLDGPLRCIQCQTTYEIRRKIKC